MYRKFLLLLVILLPLSAFAQRVNYVISPINAETVVTEEGLMQGIEFLTSPLCEGRASGTKGSFMAADWVRTSFISAGLVPFDGTWVDGFRCENGEAGHNIMGMFPGYGDRYIIIMSHFDNLGILGGNIYPGADSNASGVVAMAALANMLKRMEHVGKTYSTNVIFVGLDAKVKNFGGARQLYKLISYGMLKDPVNGRTIGRDRIDLVINLDQLGSTEAPLTPGKPEYLILLGDESYARRSLLVNANSTRKLGLDLGFS
ncbi:MAG: M28 family peptidase, partial [Clostridia bacterium]|nr:M28 family peptidase [Clostridia bacterium]